LHLKSPSQNRDLPINAQLMETLKHQTGYASDEEIIAKVLDGELALFEVLIRRYNSLLYKIARSYGLNHYYAEDVMQETHVSAYTELKSFKQNSSYKTWLTRIHLNKCYHKLNYGHLKYETADSDLITDQSASMHSSGTRQDTERVVMNKELAKVLEQSMQGLPLIYRTVFVLRELEGFSVAESSEMLGITPINVKVRLNRAKALLQKQLEQYYSTADIYEFHLRYCDGIVQQVFDRISQAQGS
jgi:RNA polymerase sigma factor (sigma-70 family)